MNLQPMTSRYERDGFVYPVDIIDLDQAHRHRRQLEHAESVVGPLHYRSKIHTLLTSPRELVTHQPIMP